MIGMDRQSRVGLNGEYTCVAMGVWLVYTALEVFALHDAV